MKIETTTTFLLSRKYLTKKALKLNFFSLSSLTSPYSTHESVLKNQTFIYLPSVSPSVKKDEEEKTFDFICQSVTFIWLQWWWLMNERIVEEMEVWRNFISAPCHDIRPLLRSLTFKIRSWIINLIKNNNFEIRRCYLMVRVFLQKAYKMLPLSIMPITVPSSEGEKEKMLKFYCDYVK
jgi:hypothetical protein